MRSCAQLTLDALLAPRTHGGRRDGAGRPRIASTVAHRARAEFPGRLPLHVTLRAVEGVALRRRALVPAFHAAITRSGYPDFRIVELNIETNHVHLVAEASGRAALARGLQGFKSGLARRINRLVGRTGPLFDDRYHARTLASPREVRNALRYVLNNARHHAADSGQELSPTWFDPYSSAAWFDGWSTPLGDDAWWQRERRGQPRPTAHPRTWLLAHGWRRHGLIGLAEVPGAPRGRPTLARREVILGDGPDYPLPDHPS